MREVPSTSTMVGTFFSVRRMVRGIASTFLLPTAKAKAADLLMFPGLGTRSLGNPREALLGGVSPLALGHSSPKSSPQQPAEQARQKAVAMERNLIAHPHLHSQVCFRTAISFSREGSSPSRISSRARRGSVHFSKPHPSVFL